MGKIISIKITSIEPLLKYNLSDDFIQSLKNYIDKNKCYLCLEKGEQIDDTCFYAFPCTEIAWILTNKKL